MPYNPKSIENLKHFQPGNNANPNGRPPSRVPEALKIILGRKKAKKFYRLSESEVNEWEAALLTMTAHELKTLAGWEDANSYARGLAVSILFDLKNGNTKTIDKLRERQFGKAVQKVELTGANGMDLLPARTLTKEEAKEFLNELKNEYL